MLRAVAARSSFTAAASELGYTQSAISKRVAALERTTGHTLVIRERSGVRLTRAGEVLLGHAATALDAIDDAERELNDADAIRLRPVRLGAFASAAAGVVPGALRRLARDQPDIAVALREGTSAVLTRALRAGNLDIALLAGVPPHAPPDDREPALEVEILAEGPLRIAVGTSHRLAGRSRVHPAELTGERWVMARSEGQERLLGVWPGSAGRPNAPYVVRDWLTKLQLVASGMAITTIPDVLVPALPPDVQHLSVDGSSAERRRLLLVRTAGVTRPETETVALALRDAALAIRAPRLASPPPALLLPSGRAQKQERRAGSRLGGS
ncbi:MAG: LysR family transcriptional regulator [Actinomycetota bacterium]|nr:LysR family transcriptional regulator [Actinomycetota bacterium]